MLVLHTSAYVSIRQHTSAYEQADDFEPRLVMLVLEERQKRGLASALEHTSAYVSIRQHTFLEERQKRGLASALELSPGLVRAIEV